MRRFISQPFDDLMLGLEHLVARGRPARIMCFILLVVVITWIVYVPIHELLHAWGCMATGGTVSELEISPMYGGTLLAKWFPYVVSGGEYAGRLSGFDTDGSDLVYLATVFAPYLLTVLIGVPLLKICTKRRHPILFGAGFVMGLAPFYNVIGDYYEIGSICITRLATWFWGVPDAIAFEGIRGDDIFKLIEEICTTPGKLGLDSPGAIAAGVGLSILSFILGILLALATYWLGHLFARVVGRPLKNATTPL